jgi:hypothetical protein
MTSGFVFCKVHFLNTVLYVFLCHPSLPILCTKEKLKGRESSGCHHNSCLWTYDLYSPVRNAFDKGTTITRASGRGLVPGNQDFLGTSEMALSLQVSAIWGPKVKISRAQPPPNCPGNGFARIKSIMYRDISISGPLVVLCT